jgi:hypothetical protein
MTSREQRVQIDHRWRRRNRLSDRGRSHSHGDEMSRGFGKVQLACLAAIERHGAPTTFTIACDAYHIEPNEVGNRLCSDAQHVAVKRALEGLQRKGLIIGFRETTVARAPGDGRVEQCHVWMTAEVFAHWLKTKAQEAATINPDYAKRNARLIKRARARGMKI